MKRNSWKFLQNLLAFFYIYLIYWMFWIVRSLHQLSSSEKKSVLHLCIFCRRKGKSILMFVSLIGKISHSLTGIEHQVYLLQKFNFSSLFLSRCSSLAQRLPCYLIRNCSSFMGWHFRFQFLFFVTKKFRSYAFCVKELRYFEYLQTYLNIYWINIQPS